MPTAISFDIVRVGDSFGAVYELLDSEPMEQFVNSSRDNLEYFIEASVKLLREIHSIDVTTDELPDMKAIHIKWVEDIREWIGEDGYQKSHGIIAKISDSRKLLHGDYHMKNIILCDGEPMLIDMDTLSYGDGIFDLATMTNSYLIFPRIDAAAATQKLGISVEDAEYIWNKTLSLYLKDKSEAEIKEEKIKCQILGIVRILGYVKSGMIKDRTVAEGLRIRCMDFLKQI